MDKNPLFQEIAENIRQDILFGSLKPGDILPAVRETAQRLKCAPGTVQRAYQELIRQGLIISRPGQGTHVTHVPESKTESPLRKASLIHQLETYLLSQIKSGYSVDEIEQAFQIALDRWRTISSPMEPPPSSRLRFVGSHDMSIAVLNQYMDRVNPACSLTIKYAGSLGGLIALAQQEAELAGCHLWDRESGDYNRPFIRRLLPGRRIGLLTLAYRRLGLITSKNNPKMIIDLKDLARQDLVFKNRQAGAGTRVWLDEQLSLLGMSSTMIRGYEDCALTHSEAASAVASNQADLTLGIESAALAYDLAFISLTTECYELAIPQEFWENSAIQTIRNVVNSAEFKREIHSLGGYETGKTGQVRWVD
jgi:molybdate-binding protein/DNA-binding transcriptional regulator YhcF (GntR family)